ncbi:MAG: hypothetical protein M3144_12040 [Actinomycetota bacterium]|nr:hypothetical protein [Actinomycetota bacterium]
MLERLPEGARTPAVARAIMSPSGVLLAGAGISAGILAGIGVPAALVVGGVIWAGKVAATVLRRRPRQEKIEPFTIQDPWRTFVHRALSTSRRFEDAVAQTPAGPLRERLAEVGGRVETAVREAWAIAKRGHALDNAVSALNIEGIRRQLAYAEREGGRGGGRGGHQEATIRALRNQLESAERLAAVSEDARERLQRLNAELAEAVARAVELSLSAVDIGALQPLGSDVETVVGELEALRLALEETSGQGRQAGGAGGAGGRWR